MDAGYRVFADEHGEILWNVCRHSAYNCRMLESALLFRKNYGYIACLFILRRYHRRRKKRPPVELCREPYEADGIAATLLGPTESLRYFTGLVWHLSERLLGVVVTDDKLTYIVPGFECSRVETLPHLPGDIAVWEEEESPAALVSWLVARPALARRCAAACLLSRFYRRDGRCASC